MSKLFLDGHLAAETCSSGSVAIGQDGAILGVFNMLFYGDKNRGPKSNLIRISGVHEINLAIKEQAPNEIHCSL